MDNLSEFYNSILEWHQKQPITSPILSPSDDSLFRKLGFIKEDEIWFDDKLVKKER